MAVSVAGAGPVDAADRTDRPLSPQAYVDAMRGRGIDINVDYLDPAGPAPEPGRDLDLPKVAGETETTGFWDVNGLADLIPVTIAIAILAAVVFGAAKYGGVARWSLARPLQAGRRRQDRPGAGAHSEQREPADLPAIVAIPDRRRALVMLLRLALERAAAANDQVIGSSQTARDVLRSLPAGWPPLSSVTELVRLTELVHFGGRPLSESGFQDCVRLVQPILTEPAQR